MGHTGLSIHSFCRTLTSRGLMRQCEEPLDKWDKVLVLSKGLMKKVSIGKKLSILFFNENFQLHSKFIFLKQNKVLSQI